MSEAGYGSDYEDEYSSLSSDAISLSSEDICSMLLEFRDDVLRMDNVLSDHDYGVPADVPGVAAPAAIASDTLKAESIKKIINDSIRKLENLPANLKSKVWTAEHLLMKSTHSTRIYTVNNKPDVAELLFAAVPPEPLKEIKKKGKRAPLPEPPEDGSIPKEPKRQRTDNRFMRLDQTFKGQRVAEEYKAKLVELLNACLRPEELAEDVWLGNPKYSYYTLDETGGQVLTYIKYLSEVLKELVRRMHEAKKNCVMEKYPYEGDGLTLNEFIEKDPQFAKRFPVGNRDGLGQMIQRDIRNHGDVVMDKEEFKKRHFKKKHDYTQKYFVVYRPEELDTVRTCLIDRINDKR
jgi:hypothetical protein